MKIHTSERLFWFLKNGAELDLDDPSMFDMYLEQVLTRGRLDDVKTLLSIVDIPRFKQGFQRIGRFLPLEVRNFWEDFFANH